MMGLKKFFVSGYRLNDENEKYQDDEEVYLSGDVDQVLTIAKDRFAELDKKYIDTRAALAKVNARLEVAVEALKEIKDLDDRAGMFGIAEEALAKLKEME